MAWRNFKGNINSNLNQCCWLFLSLDRVNFLCLGQNLSSNLDQGGKMSSHLMFCFSLLGKSKLMLEEKKK